MLQRFVAKAKEQVSTTEMAWGVYGVLSEYKELKEEDVQWMRPVDYYVGQFLG